MSNGNVSVTVDTTAVANAISRLQSNINNVAGEVRNVSNNINSMQEKLQSQMEGTFSRLDAVKGEVSRSINAAAQTKIVETATEIFGKIGIIESSERRIYQQYHKSIIRCHRTSEKFDKFNDEVKASYHTDIRRLGKYIFDIWVNHYQGVEDRINKQHTGFLATIKRSVKEIREYRGQTLEELFETVKGKLDHFLEQRKTFHDYISMITVGEPNIPVGKIAIPLIFVKQTGTASAQIKIGNEVVPGENKHLCYSLKETDRFKTYRSDHSNLEQSVHWRDMTSGELIKLESDLVRLVKKKYISVEYYDLLVQGIKKNPPKVPKQFDMPLTDDQSPIVTPPPDAAGTEPQRVEISLDEETTEILRTDHQSPIVTPPPDAAVTDPHRVEINLDEETTEILRTDHQSPIVTPPPDAAETEIHGVEINLDEEIRKMTRTNDQSPIVTLPPAAKKKPRRVDTKLDEKVMKIRMMKEKRNRKRSKNNDQHQ